MSEALWHRAGPYLSPFSRIYQSGLKLRNFAYSHGLFKTHRLDVPVISVGNITVGGTGKTPVTLYLARQLKEDPYNQNPAVLSRGYRRRSRGFKIVSEGSGPVCATRVSGDEAQLYARKLKGIPVAVDNDRVHGGHALIEQFSPSVILLDDAFQHRRIHRDLDIALVDGNCHPEAQRLLPAGPLREAASALERADLIVMANHQPEEEDSQEVWDACAARFGEERLLACHTVSQRCVEYRTGEEVPLGDLEGAHLIGFCGIARPQRFLNSLHQLGADIPYLIRFPDHHHYKTKDIERLAGAFTKEGADYLITTEKDAVKLGKLFQALPILVLEIDIEWLQGKDHLERELKRLFEAADAKIS
jgi:tetraacyldisaccharide 4'-kinase